MTLETELDKLLRFGHESVRFTQSAIAAAEISLVISSLTTSRIVCLPLTVKDIIFALHQRSRERRTMFKVIDIFAGPGGLGEGFSAFRDCAGKRKFEVSLSVEKDENAFRTLKLRAFFRHFGSGAPDEYYEYLQGRIDADTLFHSYPDAAQDAANRCLKAEIGSDKESGMEIRGKIRGLLNGADNCVLIGGPPCQAYSLIGRARNAGNPDYIAEEDPRQRLYVEYLQILADHNPAVFIMENVKGLLSATLSGQRIFSRILQDLQNPVAALKREGRETAEFKYGRLILYKMP